MNYVTYPPQCLIMLICARGGQFTAGLELPVCAFVYVPELERKTENWPLLTLSGHVVFITMHFSHVDLLSIFLYARHLWW